MKRMLATLMVLSLSLALLAGCGSQGNTSGSGETGDTIVFKVALVLADILAIAILATFMVEGVVVVQKVMAIGSHTPALSIPKWAIYLSVPISCGLMAVRIIADAVRDLRGEDAEGGEAA